MVRSFNQYISWIYEYMQNMVSFYHIVLHSVAVGHMLPLEME